MQKVGDDKTHSNLSYAPPSAVPLMNPIGMLQCPQIFPPLPSYPAPVANGQTPIGYYSFPYQPGLVDPKYTTDNYNKQANNKTYNDYPVANSYTSGTTFSTGTTAMYTSGNSYPSNNYTNTSSYPTTTSYSNTTSYPTTTSFSNINTYSTTNSYSSSGSFPNSNTYSAANTYTNPTYSTTSSYTDPSYSTNNTFTKSTSDNIFKPRKKAKKLISKLLFCKLCKIRCNSQEQFDVHVTSKKHLRNQKRFLSGEKPAETKPIFESLSCNICHIFNISNITQYNEHMMSVSHREKLVTALDTVSNVESKVDPNSQKVLNEFEKKVAETEEKTSFQCRTCMVVCNSAVSYECHLNSKKHKLNTYSQVVSTGQKTNYI